MTPFTSSRYAGLFLLGHSIAHAAPAPPTMLAASSPRATVATFSWIDNSTDETGFEFQFRQGDEPFTTLANQPADVTGISLNGLVPGLAYVFRVAAINADGASPFSSELTFVARDLEFIGENAFTGIAGEAFSETFAFRDKATSEIFPTSPRTTPPGLTADVETGILSGTLIGGQYTGFTVSTLDPIYPRDVSIEFTIDAAPIALRPGINILAATTTDIDLNLHFDDPDIGSAVRFATSEGDVEVGLFDESAPLTVKNFFAYADSGAWNGTFFHRAAKSQNDTRFVNQGGGYRPLSDGTFESIPDLPSVKNEFSTNRPNTKGTISMAKQRGRPDSATNEWFFSLEDNRTILDDQNGGFTVFGKVLSSGLSILNTINDLPTGNYTQVFDGAPRTFQDWPLREGFTDPANPGAIVSINSVTRIPTLTYTSTTPGVTITESIMSIPADVGTTISVIATDIGGLSTTVDFPVTVMSAPVDFATYAANLNLPNDPTANPDSDALTTFFEFAIGSDPSSPDKELLIFDNSGTSPTLTFPFAAGFESLTAIVETSLDTSQWSPTWSSATGLAPAGNLLAATPRPDSTTLLTVSSGVPFAAQSRQFLRLRIIQN